MGGLIASRSLNIALVEKYIRFHGVHVSRYSCQVILNHIDTLNDRMTQAYKITQELIALLEADSNFKELCYPKECRNKTIGPCVFTIKVKGNRKQLKDKISKFKTIQHQTSFGAEHSKLYPSDPWHIITKGGYTEIRLAVGYRDDAKDIYEDLCH
jgi:cystathionine beta-lyase/cystathionine gamma-synthase